MATSVLVNCKVLRIVELFIQSVYRGFDSKTFRIITTGKDIAIRIFTLMDYFVVSTLTFSSALVLRTCSTVLLANQG